MFIIHNDKIVNLANVSSFKLHRTKNRIIFKTKKGNDEIKKYKEQGVNWRLFNPQNTRSAAIYNMLCAGCSIEEIAYITDSTLIQLVKYLPDDIVEKNGEKEWKSKNGGRDKHPFKEIFD